MKKWYFSDNGQISGPFSVNDASTLLANNSNLYGWNPSFSQWLPVVQIPEFSELITDRKSVTQVSKELINAFLSKKRDLNKKINLINEAIKRSKNKLNEFEAIISKYNKLTEGLSTEVIDNIQPIEKKKLSMSKQLLELNKAVDIAKCEIIEVVQEFGDLVLNENKTINESAGALDLTDLPELKLNNKTKERDLTDSTISNVKQTNTSNDNFHKIHKDSHPVNQSISPQVSTSKVRGVDNKKLAKDTDITNTEDKSMPISNEESVRAGNKPFHDVKSKFKFVFKSKNEEAPLKLSDKLKQTNHDEVRVIQNDNKEGLEEGEEQKKRRRRRRR
jgi:hypothetical protein